MSIVDAVMEQVKSERTARFGSSRQLSLGRLIKALEKVEDKSVRVYYDFADMRPTTLQSWRGSYDELAIGWIKDDSGMEKFTVADLLAECRRAEGQVFQGYKGGDFTMNWHTPVWVDNWGECTATAVVGVRDEGSIAIIETEYQEY